MTRTLVLSEHDLDSWHARYLRGEAPAPLPYGVDALEASGFRLRGASRAADPPWRKLREVVEHRVGFPVERAMRGARTARKADVVLALLEREGAAVGLAKRAGLPPYRSTPLVVWSCWLADELKSADRTTRNRLIAPFRAADLITHFGSAAGEILWEAGIHADRTLELPWGVNEGFYVPGDIPRDIEILAVGQDRGRDYGTLVEALRGTRLTLDLVCKRENISHLDLPHNVRFHGTVPLPTYRAMLQRARVVAVPTQELVYPTGSSVALEAASSGCAVVVTRTRSLAMYVEDYVTGRTVPVGDVGGWREVLSELTADSAQCNRLGHAARAGVELRFTAHRMWTELAETLRQRSLA